MIGSAENVPVCDSFSFQVRNGQAQWTLQAATRFFFLTRNFDDGQSGPFKIGQGVGKVPTALLRGWTSTPVGFSRYLLVHLAGFLKVQHLTWSCHLRVDLGG